MAQWRSAQEYWADQNARNTRFDEKQAAIRKGEDVSGWPAYIHPDQEAIDDYVPDWWYDNPVTQAEQRTRQFNKRVREEKLRRKQNQMRTEGIDRANESLRNFKDKKSTQMENAGKLSQFQKMNEDESAYYDNRPTIEEQFSIEKEGIDRIAARYPQDINGVAAEDPINFSGLSDQQIMLHNQSPEFSALSQEQKQSLAENNGYIPNPSPAVPQAYKNGKPVESYKDGSIVRKNEDGSRKSTNYVEAKKGNVKAGDTGMTSERDNLTPEMIEVNKARFQAAYPDYRANNAWETQGTTQSNNARNRLGYFNPTGMREMNMAKAAEGKINFSKFTPEEFQRMHLGKMAQEQQVQAQAPRVQAQAQAQAQQTSSDPAFNARLQKYYADRGMSNPTPYKSPAEATPQSSSLPVRETRPTWSPEEINAAPGTSTKYYNPRPLSRQRQFDAQLGTIQPTAELQTKAVDTNLADPLGYKMSDPNNQGITGKVNNSDTKNRHNGNTGNGFWN